MKTLLAIVIVLLYTTIPLNSQNEAEALQKFLEGKRERLIQYRALRRMEVRNERFDASGWLEVATELHEVKHFSYKVVTEEGSSLLKSKLHKVLEEEKEIVERRNPAEKEFSSQNYSFAPQSVNKDGELEVWLTPRRKAEFLIRGSIFLSPSGELLRSKGTLVKNPSFWTSEVTVSVVYVVIEGVRLPLSVESTAKIRLAGESTFKMTYKYEVVNGKEVK